MKLPRPPKFPVELDDPQRAALERIRRARGDKSWAETIRKLIEENDPERLRVEPIDVTPWLETTPAAAAEMFLRTGRIVTQARADGKLYRPLDPDDIYAPTRPATPAKPLSSMSGKPSPKGGKK